MEAKKVGKIVLSVVTVGVTVTVAYYGYKAIKKHLATKKAAKEAADKKALDDAKKEAAPANTTETIKP